MEVNFLNFTQSGKMLTIADCDKSNMHVVIPRTTPIETKNSINVNKRESLKTVLITLRRLKRDRKRNRRK